jgi:hypothetical protein
MQKYSHLGVMLPICEALDTELEVFEVLLVKNINIIFVVLRVTARHIVTSNGLQRNFDISVQTTVGERGIFHLKGIWCMVYLGTCLFAEEAIIIWTPKTCVMSFITWCI